MKRIAAAVALLLALFLTGEAQAQSSYVFRDGNNILRTKRSFNCGGAICDITVPSDISGAPLTTAPGTSATSAMAVQGVAGAVAIAVNCVTGCSGGGGGGGTSSVFGAAFPTDGTAAGMSQGGLMVPFTGVSGNLNVQCANCSGSGVSVTDGAAFTAGSSLFAPTGGFFQTTATTNPLTNGQQGLWQMTATRAGFVNLRNAAGAEIGTAGAPVRTDPTGTTPQPITGTVTANAGTNLNTSLLALEGGGNLAQIVTDFGAPGSTACASDTASCNNNQQNQRIAQRITSLITALGTPFQAGGSIGNTTFASTQSGTWSTRTQDGAGNAITSTASALDINIKSGNPTTMAVTQSTSPWVVSNGGTFAVQAAQSGTWNITNISGTVSLPTGASTAANQTSVIGTKNAGTAATNALLAAGVYNSTPLTLTDTQQASLQFDANGYLKVNTAAGGGSGGTSSTFGAAFPSAGTAVGMSQGGNMVALTGTSNNLNVQCANCSGSGVSTADEATFTAGTSLFAGTGGFFQTTATSNPLTTGQQGMFQVTANRALFTNLRNAAGTEVGTAAAPLQVSLANTAANATALLVTGTGGTFPATQATASNLNATVVGTGTFAVQAAQSGTWNITNVSGTVSLPTGASTSAKQPALGTAGSASTDVITVQGIASMTPFLTNPGTAANWGIGTSTQNSTTVANGQLALAQFNTTPTTISSGNMSPLQMDNAGNLLVNIKAGAGSGGTALADGGTFTEGTTSFTPTGGEYVSGGGANCVTGKGCTVQMTIDRMAYVNVGKINGVVPLMGAGATGTGSPRTTTASDSPEVTAIGAQADSVCGTATGTCSMISLQKFANSAINSAIPAGTNLIGKVGIDQTTPGTTNAVSFTNTTLAVTNAGTFSVQLAANQSVNLAQVGGTNTVNGGLAGSQSIGGTVATNVAITDNPVNIGGQAVSSENTAVTTARKVQAVFDLVGKQIVLPYANPENFVSGAITTAMTGTTSTSLVAAPAAGLRNYITQCTFSNSHATVGTDIILQDGSGGTTIYLAPAAPAYGGATITFPTPLRQPTTATALFAANVTTGSSTKAACSGYKGA